MNKKLLFSGFIILLATFSFLLIADQNMESETVTIPCYDKHNSLIIGLDCEGTKIFAFGVYLDINLLQIAALLIAAVFLLGILLIFMGLSHE